MGAGRTSLNSSVLHGTQARKPSIPETATSWGYFLESFIGSASLMIIWDVKANIYTLAFSF